MGVARVDGSELCRQPIADDQAFDQSFVCARCERVLDVAAVNSRTVATEVLSDHVIAETLVRATNSRLPATASLAKALATRRCVAAEDPDLSAEYGPLTTIHGPRGLKTPSTEPKSVTGRAWCAAHNERNRHD